MNFALQMQVLPPNVLAMEQLFSFGTEFFTVMPDNKSKCLYEQYYIKELQWMGKICANAYIQ